MQSFYLLLSICMCELSIHNFCLLPYVLFVFSIVSFPMMITVILILKTVLVKLKEEDDSSLNRFKTSDCIHLNCIFINVNYICNKHFLLLTCLVENFSRQKFHNFMCKLICPLCFSAWCQKSLLYHKLLITSSCICLPFFCML